MGIVTAHAPKLVIIAGILILAIRELCNQAMELLGLSKEPSCSGNIYTMDGINPDDGFQYPYQQLMQASAGSSSVSNSSNAAAMARASLVSLVYKGEKQCSRFAISCRETVLEHENPKSDSDMANPKSDSENAEKEEGQEETEENCEGFECAVCLSEFEIGQELKITPNCGHVFHSDCIHRWVGLDLHDHRTTCPLCRTSLLSTSGALITSIAASSSSPSLIAGF